jgi:hypothetical protein
MDVIKEAKKMLSYSGSLRRVCSSNEARFLMLHSETMGGDHSLQHTRWHRSLATPRVRPPWRIVAPSPGVDTGAWRGAKHILPIESLFFLIPRVIAFLLIVKHSQVHRTYKLHSTCTLPNQKVTMKTSSKKYLRNTLQ